MASRTALLLTLTLAVVSGHHSLAQQALGRLAVDYCGAVPFSDDWEIWCDVYIFDVAAGYPTYIGSGSEPALSPDGGRVAFFEGPPTGDSPAEQFNLIVVDLRDWSRRTLPQHGGEPAWSIDGRIAFRSYRSGTAELYVINADGSGLRQVTSGIGFAGQPAWSRDGQIAFTCRTGENQMDLCSIRDDGTQFTRLTTIGSAHSPAFTPDGSRIAFGRSGGSLAILNADGSISNVGVHAVGNPVWSPDATRIAFSSDPFVGACSPGGQPFACGYQNVYVVNVDGTGLTTMASGGNPSWGPSSGGLPPYPVIRVNCTLLVCTFDGSFSRDDGSIASYLWKFGDGSSASGIRPVHTYAASGSFHVQLTVVDNTGARASTGQWLDVTSSPPVASFTNDCRGLVCTFDASGSTDQDDGIASYSWAFGDGSSGFGQIAAHTYAPGTYTVTLTVRDRALASDTASRAISVANLPPIAAFDYSCDAFATCTFNGDASRDLDGAVVSQAWKFGDGTEATGGHVTHRYGAAGTFPVSLTVTDNYGATSTQTRNINVQATVFHIGDLDGTRQVAKKTWMASVTIVVHDDAHQPVVASVTGIWSTGVGTSCNPDSSGTCTVVGFFPSSTPKVTFTVQGVGLSVGTPLYDPGRNHDVDGGTNGTSITLTRR